MERQLYDAAMKGDLATLNTILDGDPLILERSAASEFNGSPLHLAAARGHIDFVEKILAVKSDLAEVSDLRQRTPLHVAAAQGHVQIVKMLVQACRNMCLSRDLDGRIPLHLAAMKGKVEAVKELIKASPEASWIKIGKSGETVLHLCVVLDKLDVLKLLTKEIQDESALSAKDGNGDTVLHLAIKDRRFQVVDHLLNNCKVNLNITNDNMLTALDLLLAQIKYETQDRPNLLVQEGILRKAGAQRGINIVSKGKWLHSKQASLIVVASLMATMAFQAGVTPPGGVRPSDSDTFNAGEAIVSLTYPNSYTYFLRFNTIGFVTSLTTILLLIGSLPFNKHPFMTWCLVVTTWVTITSMAFTYSFATVVVTPKKDRAHLSYTIMVAVIVWCCVMGSLFLWHSVRLVVNREMKRRIRDGIWATSLGRETFLQRIFTWLNGGNVSATTNRSLSSNYI